MSDSSRRTAPISAAVSLALFGAALPGAFAQTPTPAAPATKAPAHAAASTKGTPAPAPQANQTTPKEGVSDAVKQAFLEDQKEKQKK